MAFEATHFLAALATAFAIVGVYILQKKKNKYSIPNEWKQIGAITNLNIFPLKSGKRMEMSNAECTYLGLKQTEDGETLLQLRDRFLIVFSEKDHEFRTARTHPKLMLINVSAHENYLNLDAPAMSTLLLQVPEIIVSKKIAVKYHCDEKVFTTDCGDEAAVWLSKYILEKETGLRLGYNDGSYERDIMKYQKNIVNYYTKLSNNSAGIYSDLSSVLLLNQKSVDDLNKQMVSPCVTSNNFRPNIVIDGPNIKPYIEDEWDWIKIGEVVFRNVKECTRCVMTTIDPETGIRSADREPLKTLKQYRISKGPEKQPIMGINLEVKKCGTISVGDKVLVS